MRVKAQTSHKQESSKANSDVKCPLIQRPRKGSTLARGESPPGPRKSEGNVMLTAWRVLSAKISLRNCRKVITRERSKSGV